MSTFILTSIAMLAFAANSILCRLALAEGTIDAGSFTLIRLISGAITLAVILLFRQRGSNTEPLGWAFSLLAGGTLFGYAILFSFAYINLAAGTGALLLFGAVQLTLLGLHWWQGQRFKALEVIGILCSLGGFVWLMLPSATRPDLVSALLMLFSGISWALFTALGKTIKSPVLGITRGFIVASCIALLFTPWLINHSTLSTQGIVLAVLSGSIASAMGYVLWYRVIQQLTLLQASISQLSVPVITLIIGFIMLGEELSLHHITTSSVVLGGIALVFIARCYHESQRA